MLSLQKTSEKDILLAHIYPDAESKLASASIWYTPKFQGAPQLQSDDIGTQRQDTVLPASHCALVDAHGVGEPLG